MAPPFPLAVAETISPDPQGGRVNQASFPSPFPPSAPLQRSASLPTAIPSSPCDVLPFHSASFLPGEKRRGKK